MVRTIAPAYTVGAMAIVERDDGRVLLVRLSYRHRWGVPGGLLRRGETPADAARREAHEEVGLDIDLLGEPAVSVDPEARRVDVVYRARPRAAQDADRVQPCSAEIVEARWFHPDRLPELQAETAGALIVLARSARAPQAVPLPGGAPRRHGPAGGHRGFTSS